MAIILVAVMRRARVSGGERDGGESGDGAHAERGETPPHVEGSRATDAPGA